MSNKLYNFEGMIRMFWQSTYILQVITSVVFCNLLNQETNNDMVKHSNNR